MHYAIEHSLKESIIRFLLAQGANPHIEDALGWDVCSKGKTKYPQIKEFKICSPELRIKYEQPVDAEEDLVTMHHESLRTRQESHVDGDDDNVLNTEDLDM